MDGFAKIELPRLQTTPKEQNSNSDPVHIMKKKKKKNKIGKRLFTIIAVFLLILLVAGGAIVLPAKAMVGSAKKTADSARALARALKEQNLDEARQQLDKTQENLGKTKKQASFLSWTGVIPFVGNYYRDLDHGLKAAEAGLGAMKISLDAVGPYADLLGLKGKGTFTGGSANERIQTAITTFEKVTPRLADISAKVEIVQNNIEAINPNRYPNEIRGVKIRKQLRNIKLLVAELSRLFISARPLLEELPKVMGYPDPKTYLVLFKNDKELRPDGGFITAYAIFRLENGKPLVEKADDIYKLDESRTKKVAAPPEILKYHKGVFEFNLRDSNLSPDYVESIRKFEELYKSVPSRVNYDGVVAVDTHVLVEAMKILGDFVVYDRTFSAENDPRCDCPKVVYELEDYSSRPVAYVRKDRKDIIGVLLLQIMQKALGVSPSQYWGQLFHMAVDELNEKHILVYLKSDKAQQSIEKLGWGGRIKNFDGDYLHINDANMAGAKSDLFVERSAKVEYSKTSDGHIMKTVTINYKNPAPPSNCNLEAGELCLNGLLRDWIRIYVPEGSKLEEFKGSELDPVIKEDLGKTVFEGFLTVKPQGSSQIIIRYTLPDNITSGVIPVLIQKQPGTESNNYEIVVDGKTVDQFDLITDKEFEIKI